ncbi:protein-L-isoaspartate O-methyltransferase family protein [Parvularcula dongshanensis]|uniref:Protein-L-isoaspartate O-methyltransferase n=1 Tax=Parvularcula dongshanensis TaxID=1173995 RepID=A0A840I310_9PROT|nr:protein-L-isoaspartate O-methyltransferase [Parvularcula dongshanensis]MBB4659229.1 protein-L-isoaspartate(D-aspartate) O-methyltransferase [Parvularcula dongshanensis]
MDTALARKHMVDSQVRPNDVPDMRLQKAMETLPREAFVPANRRALAYVERDVPLFEGRWLLKARDLSKLIHGANIQASDLVLDVGCGFGYSAAVMSQLAGVVVGLEEDESVVAKATDNLTGLGIDNAVMVKGPLPEGCPKQGPYDVIVIAGGVQRNLEGLLSQLKPDVGRLVTIVMSPQGALGHATIYTRAGEAFGRRRLFESQPSGVLPGFNHSAGFVF